MPVSSCRRDAHVGIVLGSRHGEIVHLVEIALAVVDDAAAVNLTAGLFPWVLARDEWIATVAFGAVGATLETLHLADVVVIEK